MGRHSKDQEKHSKSRHRTKKKSQSTRKASHGSSAGSSNIDDFQYDNSQYAVVSHEHSSAISRDIPSHIAHNQRTHDSEITVRHESRPIFQDELVAEAKMFETELIAVEPECIEVDNQSTVPKWGSVDDNDRVGVRWQSFERDVDRPLSADDFYNHEETFEAIGSQFTESTYPNFIFDTDDQSTYSYQATSPDDQSTWTLENVPGTTQFQHMEWEYESRDSIMTVTERMERHNHDL
ncbi:hypothetical protein EYC80_004669 [Monilinia laxa]|uniref:Uncharacterized protein n=1 Tax=Monilinia laxa TaxID=61186 RepID=A0A5N6KHN9_MONLA|nr:hypothetical protein EYC80_004669 [Monilinia laxa]